MSLFAVSPWWVVAAVVIAVPLVFVAGMVFVVWYFKYRFHKMIHEAVLEAGSALKGAEANIHSVKAVPAPTEPSPYDAKEGDEDYCEEMDGKPWEADEADFYQIDVTITPADADAQWDPTGIGVVPADFQPDDPTDVCEKMGGLHSAELFAGGRFEPAHEEQLTGAQRVRLLFGIPKGVRAVKFSSVVTYFGHVTLPAPHVVPVGSGATGRPSPRRSSLPWDG